MKENKTKEYVSYHHQKSPMFYLQENLRNVNEQITESIRLEEEKKRCVSFTLCLAKCLNTWGASVACLALYICPFSVPFKLHICIEYAHRRRRRLTPEETNQKRIAHQKTMEKNWNEMKWECISKCGIRQKASWADAELSKSMGWAHRRSEHKN